MESLVAWDAEGVYTFHVATEEGCIYGQYNMLYAFGAGKVPITIASKGEGYTVRMVRTIGDAVETHRPAKGGRLSPRSLQEDPSSSLFGGLVPVRRLIHLYGSKDYDSLLYTQRLTSTIRGGNKPKGGYNRLCLRTLKACVRLLEEKGILLKNIYVYLERHMKYSIGTCGHYMIGPYFIREYS